MSSVNSVITCDKTGCRHNYANECRKDVLYVNDSECEVLRREGERHEYRDQ